MYPLQASYGKETYDSWEKSHANDLSGTVRDWQFADHNPWNVKSFSELLHAVAFLGSMNKRLTLFYRGQAKDLDPLPVLFRDSWWCSQSKRSFNLTWKNREGYWNELSKIGSLVFEICHKLGVPRWRGLKDIREVQWSVIQHYGLWPTPLIDLTSSLRVAASFALSLKLGNPNNPNAGFLYVLGMPYSTGSISYSVDENIVLARLQSACPPIAKRPHYQEGFLVGRFPLYFPDKEAGDKSRLKRRLVAKFALHDEGSFWNDNFPLVKEDALLPTDDALIDELSKKLGPGKQYSIERLAMQLENGS